MTTRIDKRFAQLKSEGRTALISFITAGDPDLATSFEIMRGLPAAGASMIELGMPFSDPIADGPSIQMSSQRALRGGQNLTRTLDMASAFRANDDETPVILMGYYNPIHLYGPQAFSRDARAAGIDGLIVVDLPPEEDEELRHAATADGLSLIRLVTPTTSTQRLARILQDASGFIYYVSIAGITGTASPDPARIATALKAIKRQTDLPIAVGFGVSTTQCAQAIAESGADGVVIGSALVKAMATTLDEAGNSIDHTKTVQAAHELIHMLADATSNAQMSPTP